MPSPFPGMDPYLEDPALWPGVHANLLVQFQTQLNQKLRPHYYARIEERVYLSDDEDPGRTTLVPDVQIRAVKDGGAAAEISVAGETMQAVATAIDIELSDMEVHDRYLTLWNQSQQRIVTVIELLSPTNKVPGSLGRKTFLEKRREILRSDSHFVAVDLLRLGERCVPHEYASLGDYFVFVSRAHDRRRGRVWPIRLPQTLPPVEIPLLGAKDDCPLDLALALNESYAAGAFDATVDYRMPPNPPLTPAYAAWADELLRSKGFR